MIQECEDDAPTWTTECQSSEGAWPFSDENSTKLDQIRALLQSRNQSGCNPWKKLFERDEKKSEDFVCFEEMIVVGELDAEDQMTLMQSQRDFSASQSSQRSFRQSSQLSSPLPDCTRPLRDVLAALVDENKDEDVELPQDCLEIFTRTTPAQLVGLCSELDVENMSYEALAVLFDGVSKCERNLSLGWATSFLRISISDKILNLKQVAPRFFLVSLANFATHSPRAVIDGFMVPCFCHENFGVLQVDILAHLFAHALTVQHQNLFLKKALSECTLWNESTVMLMNNFLENKFEFSGELIDLLTSQLVLCAHPLDANLKFGKFIQKLIAGCNRQFSPANFDALVQVLNRNETFLKKTCLNALEKHKRSD